MTATSMKTRSGNLANMRGSMTIDETNSINKIKNSVNSLYSFLMKAFKERCKKYIAEKVRKKLLAKR